MAGLNDSINGYRAHAAAWWSARTEQEQRMLSIGGAVLAIGLVWSVLVEPAMTGREKLQKQLPQMNQQMAELQALAGEAAQLAAQPAVQPQPLNKDAVAAQLQASGLTTQNLAVTGDYIKVEFKGVPFAGLVAWLDAIRREQRVRVQEGQVTQQGPAGQVDANLTLRQESGVQ
ncbi:type II secretion system protein GspM [Pseudoduganella violaceinigra]|uniref:type II secretion system protein GspM n=1 Tax=Pseudoduganella violaceinigra TaxID=246602 RepID=UPI00047FFC31|nr:type II secretion system protein M [Pseudoduganella violaceinigra]